MGLILSCTKYNRFSCLFPLLISFLCMSVNASHSQQPPAKSNYAPPKFIVEVAGSFDLPVGDAYGHMEDFFSFKNYGLVQGVGFHANIKYGANKKGTLYPFISLGFAQLQNNDFGIAYVDSNNISSGYPLPGSLIYRATTGSSVLMLRSMFAGLGLQYFFISAKPVMPYAGLELDYNFLWGYYTQTPDSSAGSNPNYQETFKIRSASRFGFGVEAGFDYRISQNLGFLFGTKFKLANLLGKSSEYTPPVSIDPDNRNSMALLDKSAADLNSNLNKSRNITYLEFYLGFTLFLGKTR